MKHFLLVGLLIFLQNAFTQNIAKPFLPDIISQFPNVRDIAISPDGNEIMFSAQSVMGNLSAIISVKKNGDIWSNPKVASFSGQHFDLEPFFSHHGLKLYFVSTRPLDSNSSEAKDFDIWYVERSTIEGHWSEPKNLGSPINTEHGEFYPSIAENGNFYFTRDNSTLGSKDDLYVSEFINDTYTEPKALPDTVNSEGYEYNAFIAPDESYILFGTYNRKDGFGSGDLYISYNSENGWTEAKNLGNTINTNKMDYCPFVKGNTLYYTSKQDGTQTKFDTALSIEQLSQEFNKHNNGSSRLYQISADTIIK
ncbi:hypothetical protein RXV94_05045 [Yeosuana sp. MJ-SS3]|uniref:Exo-alpha-sialidase n=1 Tax=Gilvirhabdus luticola TaxID=3079858 RepID=A0ABU3U537_9FLAO|nr:hypothetical protein [Yeosuana sp. MJ-SS3]MDU8885519.1 hypothetical protein [Yeosuana sp. MJ-SS3]